MILPAAARLSGSLVRFGAVGLAATLAYAAIALALARWTALPAPLASLTSYALASPISYFGHRRLTFRSGRPHREAALPFAATTLLGYLLALAVPALAGAAGAPPEAGILATCVVVPAVNYLLLATAVFPGRGMDNL